MIAALRDLAATLQQPLRAEDVPDGLRYAVQRHFGSIDAARDAAGLPHPVLAYRWSRELLIAELRRLHHAGVRITDLGLATDHGDVLGAIRLYFDGIVDARRAAGVPEPAPLVAKKRERWDAARVIAEIEELDRSNQSIAASKVPNPLVKAGKRYFGSWANALAAAGFDPDLVRLVRTAYNEEDVIRTLRRLAKTNPTMHIGELYEQSFYAAMVRLFGDVESALARARLHDWPVRVRGSTMTRDAVLAAIRRREREGLPTHRAAVIDEDHTLWHSAMVHFGSWLEAARTAGIDLSDHNRRWSRETLIEALRAREQERRSLRASDVQREDNALYQSARAYFGSFANACAAAGVRVPAS